MNTDKTKRNALLSWVFLSVLATLFVILGVMQYRWIGEVSRAEGERLRAGLQASLHRLGEDFNGEIASACAALLPGGSVLEGEEREGAYAARYRQWKESGTHPRLFRRIALAVPRGESLTLRDLDAGVFVAGEWPGSWSPLRERLTARLTSGAFPSRRGPMSEQEAALIDLPRFRPSSPQAPQQRAAPESEWLIAELDVDYVRTVMVPELLRRHLGGGQQPDYQAEIVLADQPSALVYRSDGASLIGDRADATATLFDIDYDQIFRRAGIGRWSGSSRGRGPAASGRGRWLLAVRHHSGSLESVVNQGRRRNLAVWAAIFVLLLATIFALVRFTQRAQKLARLEMEFVAGVSHELRTPLSVIRTAAHNLGGGLIHNSKQVQRYGSLIAQEAERLSGVVEQVLRFASAKAGHSISGLEPITVRSLVDQALTATASALQESRCAIETDVAPDLPPLLADPVALSHALQNLLINAAKYGSEGGWIGITAELAPDSSAGKTPLVEIRVADRGAGIQPAELGQIFDPFYRGKRALEDQIHGTGLGLSLVKRIVEAHEGEVSVRSEPGKNTEFILRIPAAPADEFADSIGRG